MPYSAGGFDIVRAFYTTWFEQVFKVTDYALWKAILLQVSNFVATFTWSYVDMFVTLVSMALTQKYLQLYERLLTVRGKVREIAEKVG
jgi:gustatory receptor